MKSNLKRRAFVLTCVAPAVILFALFMVWPTFNVFRLSLYQRSTFNPEEIFIGLKNFEMLMKDTAFIRSMQNMLLLIVLVTIFTMGTALVFAGILTREKLKGGPEGGWLPQYKLPVDEAVRLFTSYAAKSCFAEDKVGMLKVGMLADLVVLEEDLYAVEPHHIKDVKVLRTVCGGKTVYEA